MKADLNVVCVFQIISLHQILDPANGSPTSEVGVTVMLALLMMN
jgi:hypothetical protein